MSKDLVAEYERLKKIKEMRDGLPHLYCNDLYQWGINFWNCTKTFNFLFAPNQVGKSALGIRAFIHYHTEPKLWKRFSRRPTLSFMLIEDKDTLKREIETKWKPEFLPRNGYENHPQYGWELKYTGQFPSHIIWNTGVITYFKTYGGGATKNVSHRLQASTPFIVWADEELPFQLWPELQMRILSPANRGAMFWQTATPTKGQQYLYEIQNGKTKLPDALVQTVSMYDCLEYPDGTAGHVTLDDIKRREQSLPTQREIDIRVHGRVRKAEGLAVPSFNGEVNIKESHPIKNWEIYAGIDYGIGGKAAHPPSIVFVKVKPDYTDAKIVNCWKPDNTKRWTVDEVLSRFVDMCNEMGVHPNSVNASYDWACGEMGVISERRGLGLQKANKDRTLGFATLNSLFKNQMLTLFKYGDWEKLVNELETFSLTGAKELDDLIDALRYAIAGIMFNFENIQIEDENPKKEKRISKKRLSRSNETPIEIDDDNWTFEDELNEWNEYIDRY
jgi:hypothetical protein